MVDMGTGEKDEPMDETAIDPDAPETGAESPEAPPASETAASPETAPAPEEHADDTPPPAEEGDTAEQDAELPPPNPGHVALSWRHHDFGGAPVEDRELIAYQPFAPGIWAGFQSGGQAWIREGQGASGENGVILTLEPGPSSWMSLEMELDMAALARTGAAMVTFEAAANPLTGVKMLLRIPCQSAEKGFWDTRGQSVALSPDMSRRSLMFVPQMDRLQPHDGFPRAVLIAFLPLRRTELFLSSIAFGPAA